MKKLLLVIAMAIPGIVSVNATVSNTVTVVKTKFSEPGTRCDSGKIAYGRSWLEGQFSVSKCTVTIRYKSGNSDVVVNFTGSSCTEAWNAASKFINTYLK